MYVCHRRVTRLLLGLVVAFAASGLAVVSSTRTALAYDCAANDCYGTVYWNGLVNGADTRIKVNNMSSTSSNQNWHVNNIMWVMDTDIGNQVCEVGPFVSEQAWVEIGVIARANTYKFYWAHCRPSKSYIEWNLGTVMTADKSSANYYEIFYQSTSTWYLSVTAASTFQSALSFQNTMEPDRIQIGVEAAGQSGLHADVANFTNNRYIHSSGRHYQIRAGDGGTVVGAPAAGNPDASRWLTVPAPGGTGGNWRTECGC